jgi:hypothetical protein
VRPVEPAADEVDAGVVGLVAAVANLLEKEVLHRAGGGLGDGRVQHDVGDQRQHVGPVAGQRGRGDLGVVHVGVGVERAAHPLRRLDDLDPVLGRGPAHEHELQEVRDPRVARVLRPRAHAGHEREGDHRGGRVLAHEHGEPVRELDAARAERLALGGDADPEGQRGEGQGDQQRRDDGQAARAGHRGLGTNAIRA